MEIIGYSERGAMNALFYGIALKEDKQAMEEFLKLADVKEHYNDYTLYLEFSLSEFGSPDLVIIAKDKDGNKTVFFVEAKASCGKYYNLGDEYNRHNEYIKKGNKPDGHASNLFFQLRQKYHFFNGKADRELMQLSNEQRERLTGSRGRSRQLGANAIVKTFAKELKDNAKCAKYIAIIPEQNNTPLMPDNRMGFSIHYVTWEQIIKNDNLKEYILKTIEFNQTELKSQITNKPVLK